jgi:hypothetical protein
MELGLVCIFPIQDHIGAQHSIQVLPAVCAISISIHRASLLPLRASPTPSCRIHPPPPTHRQLLDVVKRAELQWQDNRAGDCARRGEVDASFAVGWA